MSQRVLLSVAGMLVTLVGMAVGLSSNIGRAAEIPATGPQAATSTSPAIKPGIIYTRSDPSIRAATLPQPNATTRPETSPQPVAATAGAGAASRAGAGGGLDLLTNIGNVTINLPANWNLNAGGKYMLESHPSAVDKDATGSFQASISIQHIKLTSSLPGAVPKADVGLGASEQALVAKQEAGYQAVEKPAVVTIGGVAGVKFGGTFKRGAVELRSRAYILDRNGEAYRITFTSLSSKWAGYQGLIEKSVGTFTLKK